MIEPYIICETQTNTAFNEAEVNHIECNNIIDIQETMLNMLASKNAYTDILSHLCKLAENLLPNSIASIALVNKETGLFKEKKLNELIDGASSGAFKHHIWGLYVLSVWIKKHLL